jgi:hypothetical protein
VISLQRALADEIFFLRCTIFPNPNSYGEYFCDGISAFFELM